MSLIVQEHETIEDYVRSVTGLKIEAIQLSPGRFGSYSQILNLPNMTILNRGICSASILSAQLNKDTISFTFPSSDENYLVNGIQGNNQNIFSCRSDGAVVTALPASFRYAGVILTESRLLSYLSEAATEFLLSSNFSLNKINTISIAAWQHKLYLQTYLNSLMQSSTPFHGETQNALEDTIYTMLAILVEHCTGMKTPIPASTRCRVVLRALDIIRQLPNKTISTAELAKRSFCSVRTLQYSFSSLLSMSPLRFMQIRNMHLVRESIFRLEQATVKTVLSQHGVVAEGRFSNEYYAHFGEYPKQTLKKALAVQRG